LRLTSKLSVVHLALIPPVLQRGVLVSAAAPDPHLPMQTLPCNQASDEPTMHAQAITQPIEPNTLVRKLCNVD